MPSYKFVNHLWDDAKAASLDPVGRLIYRSNLLGRDQRITNTGGGNTSSKITEKDPLTGAPTEVLWVKGSGGDLRTSLRENFSSLYQQKLLDLQKLYAARPDKGLKAPAEDDMVGMYNHTTFNLNPRPSSIDTPLHSFLPGKHVDHMHPNAIIAIAASADCQQLTREIFGGEMAYVPWMRPGFELGLAMQEIVRKNPRVKSIMMGQHGFISWDDAEKACYTYTLDCIEKAAACIEAKYAAKGGDAAAFGGAKYQTLAPEQRRATFAAILPWLRGQVSRQKRFVGTVQDDEKILRFANSKDAARLAELGTSCPDHFLRTKIKPLYVDWNPQAEDAAALKKKLAAGLEAYRKDYAAYYAKCKHACSFPAWAWWRGARTSRNRASPPNSTTAPSRSCAAPRRSTNTSPCRSRKPSTSSTGCSKRRNSNACPPRRNSRARSSSSSAPVPASARKPRTAS
jgi:rhamnose utilization protein RhaD (predicted bifunctional aldolase and dehydrogenase)